MTNKNKKDNDDELMFCKSMFFPFDDFIFFFCKNSNLCIFGL